jgi:hypothetical protein
MTSPRDARIAGALTVVLVGGVVWNVAFLQEGTRDRRRAVIPVGVHVPLPATPPSAEARRPQGPVTLSLAALIEQGEGRAPERVTLATPAPSGRMSGFAQSLDRLAGSEPQAPGAPSQATAAAVLIREIQTALAARGYAPGPADGHAGPTTRAAILAFERDQGVLGTAVPSDALLAALRAPSQPRSGGARLPQSRARVAAGQ